MKRMTQWMLATGMILLTGTTAMAQKTCDLSVNLTSPTDNQVVPYGDTAYLQFAITNNGPGNIIPGDTVFFDLNGDLFFFDSLTLNNGATQSFDPGFFYTSDTTADISGNVCVTLVHQSDLSNTLVTYLDDDTTNDRQCAMITLKGSGTTGIFDINGTAKNSLELYPNPAADAVQFTVPADKSGVVAVSVKDVTGREVMRKDFGNTAGGQNKSFGLDVGSLPEGLYLVELNTGQSRAVGKLTIRR